MSPHRELSLVEGFLDAAGERFAALLLQGEPGIGETTIWREIGRRAEERGDCVLSCRPAATEAKLALSAVADLVEAVPDAVGFSYERPKGKKNCVMPTTVAPVKASRRARVG